MYPSVQIQMDQQIALLDCVRMDAICGCWAQTSPPIAVALIPQHTEFTSTNTLENQRNFPQVPAGTFSVVCDKPHERFQLCATNHMKPMETHK